MNLKKKFCINIAICLLIKGGPKKTLLRVNILLSASISAFKQFISTGSLSIAVGRRPRNTLVRWPFLFFYDHRNKNKLSVNSGRVWVGESNRDTKSHLIKRKLVPFSETFNDRSSENHILVTGMVTENFHWMWSWSKGFWLLRVVKFDRFELFWVYTLPPLVSQLQAKNSIPLVIH